MRELRKLREENEELKMLIEVYEQKEAKGLQANVPPEIPLH